MPPPPLPTKVYAFLFIARRPQPRQLGSNRASTHAALQKQRLSTIPQENCPRNGRARIKKDPLVWRSKRTETGWWQKKETASTSQRILYELRNKQSFSRVGSKLAGRSGRVGSPNPTRPDAPNFEDLLTREQPVKLVGPDTTRILVTLQ